MTKIIVGVISLAGFASIAIAGMKYECNRYVNGDYKGSTYVVADNKSQAESKAYYKFKDDLGKKVDYVKCK